MIRRDEVDAAADVLGDLDWVRAWLANGASGKSFAAMPDDVWMAVLGAVDAAEAFPGVGPLIASLSLDGLLTPLSLPGASFDRVALIVSVDAAIATIEAWVDCAPNSERAAELRRRRTEDVAALHARATGVSPKPSLVRVAVVLRCGQEDISRDNLDLLGEKVEVALGRNGEYVGHDYGSTTGILQIYLLGPDLSAMTDAVLPAVERFAGQGSYYESRWLDDPSNASSVRVDL